MDLFFVWDQRGRLDILTSREEGMKVLAENPNEPKNEYIYRRYDPKEIWNGDDGEIYQYQTSERDWNTYCTKIQFPEVGTKLYFLSVLEENRRNSYGRTRFLFVATSIEGILEILKPIFDTEHNRDEECEICATDDTKCWNDLKDKVQLEKCNVLGTDNALAIEIFMKSI